MSNLIPQNVTGTLQIKSMEDLSRLSVMLSKSGYFTDSKEAAQAGVKVLAGLEMGFGAVASMTGIHIIKGKPTIGANLMAAAVKRSGKYNYRITTHDGKVCTVVFYENGEVIGESSFSLEDAQKAGVANGDNWRKFPRNMLFSRALSNGVRWYCPDVLLGVCVYTLEEMGAQVDEEGNAVNVEIIQQPKLVEKRIEIEPTISTNAYDRNLLNAEIESIIKHKNIAIDAAKGILFELFHVRSRQFLKDEQLAQFLDYLKSRNCELIQVV
ncbi:MAG: recombinase RecT [Tolypothrix brevis GSE-NOS-MK-07-07A]|jgi:hypothetical protein|nr:recombinase RecT [Tolypothrix brevis GSE-NOS-MK-07-07A]